MKMKKECFPFGSSALGGPLIKQLRGGSKEALKSLLGAERRLQGGSKEAPRVIDGRAAVRYYVNKKDSRLARVISAARVARPG
jgi:hypothetical protein